MRVALLHNAVFPVHAYGGTERVVWWLAKGLKELGHEVVLVAAAGSRSSFGEVRVGDFSSTNRAYTPGVDVEHHFAPFPGEVTGPHLLTVGGNGKSGETFPLNTVFVSRNHAQRHQATSFVYNGIDPEDYLYQEKKADHLLFLAKASWKVKNVRGAIRIARRARSPLHIVGGSRRWLPYFRGVSWKGMLGGREKASEIASSRGLLFPVLWHEPFGIAVIEALVSGSPVIASPWGSLPELVHPDVGVVCDSERGMIDAVGALSQFKASRCREYALEHFHYRKMAADYVTLYEKVIEGKALNASRPRAPDSPEGAAPRLTLGD